LNVFLGIDTSAYTTSVALVSEDTGLLADERIMLRVDLGQRGLRQSDAHFEHSRNLPSLLERISPFLKEHHLSAIGVSDRPRRIEDSYMPVFLAGLNTARSLAAVGGYPLYLLSHQEGHIEAALKGLPLMVPEFLAVHFSGGTSEVLLVKRDRARYDIKLLLATKDINAGQLVDRVGVAMGLPFPAGRHMERMARGYRGDLSIPSAVDAGGFSFSGAETRASSMLAAGVSPETVSFLVFQCIANTLEKSLRAACRDTGVYEVVMAGGVMANALIRTRLTERLTGSGIELYWAEPGLSTDNAVGTAIMARNSYYNERGVIFER